MTKPLTPKQQAFVDQYLVDLNATQAAIRSGYSPATAKQQGARLLTNADILAAVASGRVELADRTKITQDWVLERLASVAERCLQHEPVLDRKGQHVEVETPDGELAKAYTFNAAGANGALNLLGKHLGMFTEKVEHSGGVDVNHTGVDRPAKETRDEWLKRQARELGLGATAGASTLSH